MDARGTKRARGAEDGEDGAGSASPVSRGAAGAAGRAAIDDVSDEDLSDVEVGSTNGAAVGGRIEPRGWRKVLSHVVKVYVTHTKPHYSMPWQMKQEQTSTSSGFAISGRRILTNAHSVAYHTSVQVRRHGSPTKVPARVLAIGHDSDTALLTVDSDDFWAGMEEEPLDFGETPELQAKVTVVGYPTGGDNISITAGVVSRIDFQQYSHSYASLLTVQIDAAINAGNSGGPAFHRGKVVGIAFETLEDAENIGYIIPTPVIRRFLDDVARNAPRIGFGRLGFQWQAVENAQLRDYLHLKEKQTGVLITKAEPLCSVRDKVLAGDVVTAIDGHAIAEDGTVEFRGDERITFSYHVSNKRISESVRLTLLRNGTELLVDVPVADLQPLVPPTLYDCLPSYLVHAGLVFTVLSEPFLHAEWGKHWVWKAPVSFVHVACNGVKRRTDEQVVILTQILAHKCNIGYEKQTLSNIQLLRFNGTRIRNLAQLSALISASTAEFNRFDLADAKCVILRATESAAATAELLKIHSIPAAQSADLAAAPPSALETDEDSKISGDAETVAAPDSVYLVAGGATASAVGRAGGSRAAGAGSEFGLETGRGHAKYRA